MESSRLVGTVSVWEERTCWTRPAGNADVRAAAELSTWSGQTVKCRLRALGHAHAEERSSCRVETGLDGG